MLFDTTLCVCGETKQCYGDDSYYSVQDTNQNSGIIAVFDGCGGLGGRKYIEYNGHTGAYLSSHLLCCTMKKWNKVYAEKRSMIGNNNNCVIIKSLEDTFNESLGCLNETDRLLKGSMVRPFPSTASIIIYSIINNALKALFIWAGDSRGYLLNEKGLAQITVDDINNVSENDAMQNLSNDGKLINVVSADKKYHLNKKQIVVSKPCILITSTDGCFSYYRTPMEFEFMLLDTLYISKTPEEWREKIDDELKSRASDDYTLCMSVFGYTNFNRLKNKLIPRHDYMYNEYISKLDYENDQLLNVLWNKYKAGYYRG